MFRNFVAVICGAYCLFARTEIFVFACVLWGFVNLLAVVFLAAAKEVRNETL